MVTENGKRVEVGAKAAAETSAQYRNKAYHKWLPPAICGKWGGGDALVMPDLEKMSVDVDRKSVFSMLRETMKKGTSIGSCGMGIQLGAMSR